VPCKKKEGKGGAGEVQELIFNREITRMDAKSKMQGNRDRGETGQRASVISRLFAVKLLQ
jgi:hypothetical protein